MIELYGSDDQAIRTVAEVRARFKEAKRDFSAYVRPATCDSQGAFVFKGLPDGGWYLIVRALSASGQELVALRRVRVAGGETKVVHVGM
jgi:hypothetical protein